MVLDVLSKPKLVQLAGHQMTTADGLVLLAAVLALILAVATNSKTRRYGKILATVPGPRPASFWLGSTYEHVTSPGFDLTRAWIRQYGPILRVKALFGADKLIVSDPTAMQYIMNTATYAYPKTSVSRTRIARVLSVGLVWAEGDVHRRQRRVMYPSFTKPKVSELLPHFVKGAEKLCDHWHAEMGDQENKVINVMEGLSCATMDLLGQAAFGLQFRCLEDPGQPIMRVYRGFLALAVSAPSPMAVILNEYTPRLPAFITRLIFNLPFQRYIELRRRHKIAEEYATKVIQERLQVIQKGDPRDLPNDILTSFVAANSSENEKTRLTMPELVAQIRTLIFAGHDSTTHTISWALYLLATHPEVQQKVREELQATYDSSWTFEEFDRKTWLNAAIYESMRVMPAVPTFMREAAVDDIVPLSRPLQTSTGKFLDCLPVPKGTEFHLSIADYNTSEELWGSDSYEYKPERFLREEGPLADGVKPAGGSFHGMMSFLTGPRMCLGWRFAMLEVQVVLASILTNFEVALREPDMKVDRLNAPIMSPVVDGIVQSLPLKLTKIAK